MTAAGDTGGAGDHPRRVKMKPMASVVFWSGQAAALGLFLLLSLAPGLPGIGIIVREGLRVYIVPYPLFNFLLTAVSLLVPVGAWLAWRRLGQGGGASRGQHAIYPLAFLPVAFLPLLTPRISLPIATNVAFFLPLGVGVGVLLRVLDAYGAGIDRMAPRRVYWALLIGLTLAYTVAGYRIFLRVGEHLGDECHYIVQISSLREDGDLDLRNNLGVDLDEVVARLRATRKDLPASGAEARRLIVDEIKADLHISPRSPRGCWYSWHPWGLPVVLLPFAAMGPLARQLGLGLFAALGCAVAFLLCVRSGNTRGSSLVMAGLTGVSTYWFTYASRCLPETLGATLFVCAVYAAHLYATRPRCACLIFAVTAAYLPCAHVRFAPCSLLAAGYFVLRTGWLGRGGRIVRRAPILSGLAAIVFVALLGGLAVAFPAWVQRAVLYPTQGVLFAYPEGIWLSLFSNRGLFYSFPLGMFLVLAVAVAVFTDRPARLLHLLAMLAVLAVLVTSGAADCWDGGSTLAGRYLLVLIPVMLPAAAHVYRRSTRWGRGWIMFLGLYSAAYFTIAMAQLANLPRDFLHRPCYTFKYCLPLLRDLFAPYQISDILVGHPYQGLAAVTQQLFPLVFFVVTAVFVLARPRRLFLHGALLAAFVAFGIVQHATHNTATQPWRPEWIESAWAKVATPYTRTVQCPSGQDFPLERFSNRFAAFEPVTFAVGDTAASDAADGGAMRHIDREGYEVAGRRWLEIAPGFRAGATGPRLLRVRGRQTGDAVLRIAVCDGSRMLLDAPVAAHAAGTFDFARILSYTRGAGNVRILAGLEGATGRVRIDALQWTPVGRREAVDYR
jgi:hypothetical protein